MQKGIRGYATVDKYQTELRGRDWIDRIVRVTVSLLIDAPAVKFYHSHGTEQFV